MRKIKQGGSKTRLQITIKTGLITVLTACLWPITGCADSASIVRWTPADSNNPVIFAGRAADVLAEKMSVVLSQNIQTKEGRLNELIAIAKKYFGWLIITLVGGLIFWGFTRSRYGWVVPAASIAGMAVILSIAKLAKWIPYVVVAIGLGLFVWKAVEYQRERNEISRQKSGEQK